MEILPSILTIILSVTTSSVAAAFVSFHLSNSKERKTLIRNKIEDVYLSYKKYTTELTCHFAHFATLTIKEHNNGQNCEPIKIPTNNNTENLLNHLEMNITIYFPTLQDDLNQLIRLRDQGNNILLSFIKAYAIPNFDSSLHYTRIKSLINDISMAEKKFYNKLTQMAFELNSAQPFFNFTNIFNRLKQLKKS